MKIKKIEVKNFKAVSEQLDGVIIIKKREEIIFQIPTGFGFKEFLKWKKQNEKAIKKIKARK